MNSEDYAFLSEFLQKKSGLALGQGKEYLVTTRLNPVAASMGLTDVSGLVQRLRFRPDPSLVQTVYEAMTTNESMFFRDVKPFDNLRDHIFPHLMKLHADTRRLRIWCAACSTGQEPYSIAMLIRESLSELNQWDVEIVCTDISTEIPRPSPSGLVHAIRGSTRTSHSAARPALPARGAEVGDPAGAAADADLP